MYEIHTGCKDGPDKSRWMDVLLPRAKYTIKDRGEGLAAEVTVPGRLLVALPFFFFSTFCPE
jgi:hypothetical protein